MVKISSGVSRRWWAYLAEHSIKDPYLHSYGVRRITLRQMILMSGIDTLTSYFKEKIKISLNTKLNVDSCLICPWTLHERMRTLEQKYHTLNDASVVGWDCIVWRLTTWSWAEYCCLATGTSPNFADSRLCNSEITMRAWVLARHWAGHSSIAWDYLVTVFGFGRSRSAYLIRLLGPPPHCIK